MDEKEKKETKSVFLSAISAIRAIKEKEGTNRKVAGEIPCPTCGKPLRYSIAYNGHIHGRCEGGETVFMM